MVDSPSWPFGVKLYGFGTDDKYTVSFDMEGTTDYCLISFYINGKLPKRGGYITTLSQVDFISRWSCPIDGFLFTMEHLRSIMGAEFLDSHVQVRSFDHDVTQAISQNKLKNDVNGLYWGNPQKIHLKKR